MIAPDTLLQNRYLVIKQIGEGGMGAVYVATDQRFGSTVALKETFFTDPSLRRAFEREARLLNRLRHPALPRVSDHFTEEEGQFLVMEFIAGDDLSDMLKERGAPFPPSEVLAWADQLLDALDYLHTQDPPVVHRDIKPQNLKLAGRNQIVLLDFGLAKGTPAQLTRATAQGSSVFGYSLNYAPIEQMQGAGTDPRSDLYSLAATLYHLLTGVAPPDALTRATAVLNGQPDPLRAADEVTPHLSRSVASVLGRALAQSAAQRPQTAHEMREALRAAARDTTGQTTATADDAATRIHAASAADSSEQQTRLLGSRTSAAPSSAKDTNVQDYGAAASTEMATLVGHSSGARPSASTRVDSSQTPTTAGGEDASVVTRVRPTAARRGSSPLAGRVAAAVVGLAAIVGVYAYVRQTPAPVVTSTQTPTPTPAATPEPTPAPVATETQPLAPTPAPQAQRPGRQQGKAAPSEDAEVRRGEGVQTPRPPLPPRPRESEFGLTPEEQAEIQRNAEEARREGERARREALRSVRQMLEQQRRQRIQEERRRRDEERRRPLPTPPAP